ncbi:ribosome maturation factor RimM [soil metagenome]|jgi:16S rRNA processing protein RimM|nr:ribosome maturation factor RimM [Actinomycetota bacterium]
MLVTPQLLEVGRVVRAHGLTGEVAVKLVTDREERLAPGTVLHTASDMLEVVASQPYQAGFLVRFAGVGDRNAAEALRGVILLAPALSDPEAFWVHELIGSEVVGADDVGHGRVVAVEANPASDLLVLEGGGLVPLRFVVERAPGRLIVELPAGLLD